MFAQDILVLAMMEQEICSAFTKYIIILSIIEQESYFAMKVQELFLAFKQDIFISVFSYFKILMST